MYEISVQSHFSSAHRLRGYKGACQQVHGHNWKVKVFLRGSHTDSLGMLIDFRKIKTSVRGVLRELDHQDLNCLPAFARINPTAENLARYIYDALSKRLRRQACCVHRVWVSESPGTSACYWEEDAADQGAQRRQRPGARQP